MQLLKVRGFSEFFTDTFQFIKENAAHFFLNYFIFNGIFLLLYFAFNYFNNGNIDIPIVVMVLMGVLLFVFYIINLVFVPIYMILYNERGINFDHSDILNYMTQNAGKILIFILFTLLMSIPLIIAAGLSFFILIITIVGILAMPLLFAAYFLWFQMTLFEYLYTKKEYFEALGYGFTLFTKKIWATTGSTALMYSIIMIVYYLALGITGVFSGIFAINFADPESVAGLETIFKSPIILMVGTAVSILFSLISISQGIIYFSQKEFLEGINQKMSIEEIGKSEE